MHQMTHSEVWLPGWAIHPGEILEEHLESNGLSQAEFARRAGITPKLVSTIVSGDNPVTPDTALLFERVLGLKAEIWLGIQKDWDLFQAREKSAPKPTVADSILKRFPVKELVRRGCIASETVDALLAFLGVGSIAAYEQRCHRLAVNYRRSSKYESTVDHVFAWLQIGEIRARSLNLPPYDSKHFLDAVRKVRRLTLSQPSYFVPEMVSLCRKAGVAVVLEPPFEKMRLSGAARWWKDDGAIIMLSLRHKTNDHFWFTFFHECAHIVLHAGDTFADDFDAEGDGRETEANEWAEEVLVGRERFRRFVAQQPRSQTEICEFADAVEIHPAIVVGMLQHCRIIPWQNLNRLKEKFEWSAA